MHWQIQRKSDKAEKDVTLLAPGGYANSTIQDQFCAGTDCVIWRIYDQSGFENRECAATYALSLQM